MCHIIILLVQFSSSFSEVGAPPKPLLLLLVRVLLRAEQPIFCELALNKPSSSSFPLPLPFLLLEERGREREERESRSEEGEEGGR
jgi:hypothetical protein